MIATVEHAHQLMTPGRIGGATASLKVREGDVVASGKEIATIADQRQIETHKPRRTK